MMMSGRSVFANLWKIRETKKLFRFASSQQLLPLTNPKLKAESALKCPSKPEYVVPGLSRFHVKAIAVQFEIGNKATIKLLGI